MPRVILVGALVMLATPVSAQHMMMGGPIANEISVGVFGAADGAATAGQGALRVGFGMVDSGDDTYPHRTGYAMRFELAGPSQTAACQDGQATAEEPDSCFDGAVLVGILTNPVRRGSRQDIPYIEVLAGAYWKGSGLKDPAFTSTHAAIEIGGGFDIRHPDSKLKLRLGAYYRKLFGGGGWLAGAGAGFVWGPR